MREEEKWDKDFKAFQIRSEPFNLKRILCWLIGHDVVIGYTETGLPILPVMSEIRDGDGYDLLPLGGVFSGSYKRDPDNTHKCVRCGMKLYEFYRL